MQKYGVLLNILDKIRLDADSKYSKKYHFENDSLEKINQARARALIHLYLKVGFGIQTFQEIEKHITDGANDGGIDGYFIHQSKTIYLIQSKYRTTEFNFENKSIDLNEILSMDVKRIISGQSIDENGIEYNGKIKQLQREISQLDDIAKFNFKVVFLANLNFNFPDSKIKKLIDNFEFEVIDYKTYYSKLIFPVITGTYFNATDIKIHIDLSNKESENNIRYKVPTKFGLCEIRILFIPTLEFAKIFNTYKNSLLKNNPRSYLEFIGKSLNKTIKETLLVETTNEFAIYNNGITLYSEETFLSDTIGQKEKSQLILTNPQIINGGQTAYTLSEVYDELSENESNEKFKNKEVLLKIYTLNQTANEELKNDLINSVSKSTNLQSPVFPADRLANENFHKKLQKVLFDNYGIFYERKRGEFNDGIKQGYIPSDSILKRNLFFKLFYASQGQIEKCVEKKLFETFDLSSNLIENNKMLNEFYFAYLAFKNINTNNNTLYKDDRTVFGQVYIFKFRYMPNNKEDFEKTIKENIKQFRKDWAGFIEYVKNKPNKFNHAIHDAVTQKAKSVFDLKRWRKSHHFTSDLIEYF